MIACRPEALATTTPAVAPDRSRSSETGNVA
jgi:hypothetical protein